jgi:hypothetical protein
MKDKTLIKINRNLIEITRITLFNEVIIILEISEIQEIITKGIKETKEIIEICLEIKEITVNNLKIGSRW